MNKNSSKLIQIHLESGYSYLADSSFGVNDEKTAKSNALLFDQNTVIFCQFVVLVAVKRNIDTS